MVGLRIPTRLPDDLEALVAQTIGACIAVHSELGPGLLEGVHARAIACELSLFVNFNVELLKHGIRRVVL